MKVGFLAGAVFFVSITGAFAGQPLTGTYQVVASAGCEQQLGDVSEITLVASESGIKNVDGPYSFQVGTVTSSPSKSFFNEFESSFTGSFSSDGSVFKAVENSIDRLNPVPSFAGEVDLVLSDDVLTIDNSLFDGSHAGPSPVTTCLLNKVK